jgi:trehalose 6-phosphate synthase/phosphatase
MPRLVIISNRLPITIKKRADELKYYPSDGGLATGLNSLDESLERIWIGWPGREIREPGDKEIVRKNLHQKGLIPVFLTKKEIRLFYEGFSNKTIWPHFHYFTQYTTYRDQYWEAYKKVNQHFLEVVNQHLKKDDLVWVHDYQLMLLPAMIRKIHSEVSIGFFLHIPFPSYEIFRILPWRRELLEGVLGADLIGFHTFDYMRHFLSAAYRITGYEHSFGKVKVGNRIVNVDVFPMGIDYYKYASPELDIYSDENTFKIKQMAKGKKLVIAIDRLDYTKGIPERIRAFKQFIVNNADYVGKVTLVQIVVPSRSNVDQYQDLKVEIDTLVGEINASYSTFDWTPIRYFYRSLSFKELITLYKSADVAMITPLRDGMNLIAKEYVASKEISKKGVLILSEMAGAASELVDALIVNPQDVNGMESALLQAIEMPAQEQRDRLEKMQEKLKKYSISQWSSSFIKEQIQLKENQKHQNINRMNIGQRKELLDAYKASKHRLIMLDYDGTLMDFHPNPQAVVPDEELINILSQLTKIKENKLVINSGRDKTTLQEWLGPFDIDMAAEHGVWIKQGAEWKKDPGLASQWKAEIKTVLENLVERTPGSFIEEKDFSLAWHYRRIDKDLGEKRVREFRDVLRYLTANLDLQVLEGNKVVEIKNAGVNKGKATLNWLNAQEWDFILALGDDRTDEDTFKVLPDSAYTIKVGLQSTLAKYHLISVEEVRGLLKELIR